MSLLIVNSLSPSRGRGELTDLSARISALARRARLANLPIAHLHQGTSGTASVLQLPIGRYDLVFRTHDLRRDFPGGLIEFFVNSPGQTINLAGAVRPTQLRRLVNMLAGAGIAARHIDGALISLDETTLV